MRPHPDAIFHYQLFFFCTNSFSSAKTFTRVYTEQRIIYASCGLQWFLGSTKHLILSQRRKKDEHKVIQLHSHTHFQSGSVTHFSNEQLKLNGISLWEFVSPIDFMLATELVKLNGPGKNKSKWTQKKTFSIELNVCVYTNDWTQHEHIKSKMCSPLRLHKCILWGGQLE